MRRLNKMIETVRLQGISMSKSEKPDVDPRYDFYPRGSEADTLFWEAVDKVGPYVFSSHGVNQSLIEIDEDKKEQFLGQLPFDSVSVEIAGKVSLTASTDNIGETYCILTHTTQDRIFHFIDIIAKTGEHYVFICETGKLANYFCNIFVNLWIRTQTERIGQETVNVKYKVGSGKGKSLKRIRRVLHVAPKEIMKKYAKSNHIEVDWSHRWKSSGHYRYFYKLDGSVDRSRIGKDPQGNYCQAGRTWVVPSIKGPEDKPLIVKQRIVK